MRTLVYGFFNDEMRGSNDYYQVFYYMLIFLFIDIFMPIVIDPFFTSGSFLFVDVIEAADILPIFFLSLIPLTYFATYKAINGYAVVQAMFLYVVLLGWIPLFYEELFFQDSFFFFVNLLILFEYFLVNEYEDELDEMDDNDL